MDIQAVHRRIELIEKLEQDIRISKQALKDELENEPGYLEVVAETKEILTKKKRIKDEILSVGNNKQILESIKDNQEELNTLSEVLAQELMEHYQTSKTNEIEDASGAPRKFVLSVKILPKKGNYKN